MVESSKVMMTMGVTAKLFLALQLVHILAVHGFPDTSRFTTAASVRAQNSPGYSTVRPDLRAFASVVGLSNFTVQETPPLPLPAGSLGSCHVAIGDQTYATPSANSGQLDGNDRRRLLTDFPPPDMPLATVEVWTTNQLVQAILAGTPTIIIADHIDLTDAAPLPGITKKITIMGNCMDWLCRLDAMWKGNIFNIGLGGYLTLKDLELRNGWCTAGGAVLVSGSGSMTPGEGGKLLAMNVRFFNNTATEGGGAIAALNGGLAYYHGCIFIGNTAMYGGAVYIGYATTPIAVNAGVANTKVKGSAEGVTTSALPMGCSTGSCASSVDTLFYMNMAETGGALYVDDNLPSCSNSGPGAGVEIMNSRFMNNIALAGAGIMLGWETSGAVVRIRNSDFVGNAAEFEGENIYATPGKGETIGTKVFAYQTEFSGNGHGRNITSVMIGDSGNATFSDCLFHDWATDPVVCAKSANCEFCPYGLKSTARLKKTASNSEGSASTVSKKSGLDSANPEGMMPMGEECPLPSDTNLCGWVPSECLPSSPPPPSPPLPMSPPPPPSPMMSPPPPPPSPPPPVWSPPPPTWSPPPPSPPHAPPPPFTPPPPVWSPPPPTWSPPPPTPWSPPPPTWSPPPPAWSPPPTTPWSPPPPVWSPPPPAWSPPPPTWSPPPPPYTTPPPPSPPPPPAPHPPPPTPMPPTPLPPCMPPARSHAGAGKKEGKGSIHKSNPHFVGKHGEKFPIHAAEDRDYCIISDKDLHLNMHVFAGIKKGTTYISQIGMMYKGSDILIVAQAKTNASTFQDQWSLLVNNVEVKRDKDLTTADGLVVRRIANGARMSVPDELDMNVTVSPATFTPQGAGSNYLNFKIDRLKVSPEVHGVLGQTYQETKEAYKKLHEANGKKGESATTIFVDGAIEDYATSGILAADCKFAKFEGRKTLMKRVHRILLNPSGIIFSHEGVDEVSNSCSGFGNTMPDCKTNTEL